MDSKYSAWNGIFKPRKLLNILQTKPSLILGTAMWGWTTDKATCFELLDTFYAQGLRQVDAATNYPINKNIADFRPSERILKEWIDAHGVQDLELMMKVGSINNLRTPEHNLNYTFLKMNWQEYGFLFGKNLRRFMVHWDNREDIEAIQTTFELFKELEQAGMEVGFSGVVNPSLYAQLNEDYGVDFYIQMKHNLLHSDYEKYEAFHGNRRFIAYGINAGGIKLDGQYSTNSSLKARGGAPSQYEHLVNSLNAIVQAANAQKDRESITNFNQLGMIYAYYSADMEGILLGTSKKTQLLSSIAFHEHLAQNAYKDVFEMLQEI